MTPAQFLSSPPPLAVFPDELRHRSARSDPRGRCASHVRPQLADLPGKRAQPIPDFGAARRRSVREFGRWSEYQHAFERDGLHRIGE